MVLKYNYFAIDVNYFKGIFIPLLSSLEFASRTSQFLTALSLPSASLSFIPQTSSSKTLRSLLSSRAAAHNTVILLHALGAFLHQVCRGGEG